MDESESKKEKMREKVLGKACLCDHLGNGSLIELGILEERRAPQAICPGPNIAWFGHIYSLGEMVSHIYGRGKSLVPAERPHMFAKEIMMYVDYFEDLVEKNEGTAGELKKLTKFKKNLENGINYCLALADGDPYEDENLKSIQKIGTKQLQRIKQINHKVREKEVSSV